MEDPLGIRDTRIRPTKLRNWTPKAWRPEYERIVGLSCAGLSNKMIAQEVGFTPVHVSNILNLDQAEAIRQVVLKRMREGTTDELPQQMTKLAKKALMRVQDVLDDDELAVNHPFQMMDRSLRVLEGTNNLKNRTAGGDTNIDKAIIIAGDQASNLFSGLAKADEARRLNANVG